MRTHKPTPDHILEIGYAYWKSKTLLSAVELDLFTVLAQGPLDCDQLTGRLGLAGRQARDFFDALVSLDLLVRDIAGHYANTSETEAYLSRGSSTYIGGALALQNASGYQSWGALTAALRSGAPKKMRRSMMDSRRFVLIRPLWKRSLAGCGAESFCLRRP